MNSKRLYFILCGVIGLLMIGLVAGTYGANNLLTAQAGKLNNLKAKDQALAQEQLILAKAKKEVKTYSDLEKITHSVVPEDKNQAESVREIVNIAGANNIALASISFPASSLGAGPSGTAAAGAGAASPAAGAAAGASSSSSGALSQLTAVKNIPGVYLLQITINGDPNKPVLYNQFINFLTGLEHNRRTAQVSTINLQPDTSDHNLLTFTLTLNEYIKP